jgi:UrcA family protein
MNNYTISGFRFRTFALVSALAVLGASPALADEAGLSVKVSYADLDLSTQAGATTLFNRIRSAARTVCGHDDWSYSRWTFKRCFDQAVGNAVAKVNSPQLTALYQGKSPAVTAMVGR